MSIKRKQLQESITADCFRLLLSHKRVLHSRAFLHCEENHLALLWTGSLLLVNIGLNLFFSCSVVHIFLPYIHEFVYELSPNVWVNPFIPYTQPDLICLTQTRQRTTKATPLSVPSKQHLI